MRPYAHPNHGMTFSLDYPSVRLLLDGMLLMMALYGLFSFAQHRQAIHLFYAAYMVCMIARFGVRDFGGQLPYSHALESTLEGLAIVAYIQFASWLMDIPHHDPLSRRVLNWMTANLILAALIEWIFYALRLSPWTGIVVFVLSRVLMVAGTAFIVPRLFRQRHPTLKWFISGTAFFVGGAFVSLTYLMNPTLFMAVTEGTVKPLIFMQIGVVIEVLFFTMGLSVRNRLVEQDKLQAQADLIEQLRENERKQNALNGIRDDIARDLHDTVGSDLSTISLLAGVATHQPDRAPELFDTIGQTARRVIDTMREIVWNLNSANHTTETLNFRIREIAYELFTNDPTTTVTLDIEPDGPDTFPAPTRKEILLIVKESLQNIRKHAQATQVSIQWRRDGESGWQLVIQDNGIGFDIDDLKRQSGLRNLKQRAETLGGSLETSSRPGDGTMIRLVCPTAQVVVQGIG
ncbi:MAG: sensor histidine kinase [Cytophagales bacterium]|nr:MAG: sensor histidine kinase [Cytophagales bacterium]